MKRCNLLITFFSLCLVQVASADSVKEVYGVEKGSHLSTDLHYSRYMLYLGSFRVKDNAMKMQSEMSRYTNTDIHVARNADTGLYRVYVGPLSSARDVVHVSRELMAKQPKSKPILSMPDIDLPDVGLFDTKADEQKAAAAANTQQKRMKRRKGSYKSTIGDMSIPGMDLGGLSLDKLAMPFAALFNTQMPGGKMENKRYHHTLATSRMEYSYNPQAKYQAPKRTSINDGNAWFATGAFGYTTFQPVGQNKGSGQTMLGRLSLSKDLFNVAHYSKYVDGFNWMDINMGIELGVQNGLTGMPVYATAAQIDDLGGVPFYANVMPIIDLLGTARMTLIEGDKFFGVFKAGAAYRRMSMSDSISVFNKLSKVNGEIQAGFGTTLSRISTVDVVYQGIYGGSQNLTVNEAAGTGSIRNIPSQNGVLVNFNVSL